MCKMKEMGLLFSGYVEEQRVFRQPFRIERA